MPEINRDKPFLEATPTPDGGKRVEFFDGRVMHVPPKSTFDPAVTDFPYRDESMPAWQPDDFGPEPKWGKNLSDPDDTAQTETPFRDVLYDVFGLQQGDSAREQLKTGLWELKESAKQQIPLWGDALRNLRNGVAESARNTLGSVDPAVRRAAVVGMVGLAASAGLLATSLPETEPQAEETEHIINAPHIVTIAYTVPESSPRLADLAKAVGADTKQLAEQLAEQVGSVLSPTQPLPKGQVLSIQVMGANYRPNFEDTFQSISERFGVTANVLLAANPELAGIGADGNPSQVVEQVIIPKPVTIVQLTDTTMPEAITEDPVIAEIVPDEQSVLDVDPSFDGQTLVIPGVPEVLPALPADTTTSSSAAPASTETTTTTATEQPTTPEVVITPEIQRVNAALDAITLDGKPVDLVELTEAIKGMYAAYLPHDQDRLPDTPTGTVRMLLLHEAPGLSVPFTVAERTADIERYVAPETYAVFLATAKLYQLRIAEFPQLAGSMLRMRDGDAPAHATHNDGTSLDISSAFGWEVEQYADGPFGDYQFSSRFEQAFNEVLLRDMARLFIGSERAIKRVLSSGNTMVPRVNDSLGFVFMKDVDDNHKDHYHIIINPAFAQPQWRPRAVNLPWSVDQDLRIGGAAQAISAEQHASQHADFEAWVAEKLRFVAEQQAATTTTTAPAPPTTEAPRAPIESLPGSTQDFLHNQLPKVEALKDVYVQIEQQTGVPWQIMAAIHYREGMNDPTKSMMAGERIGAVNPDQGVVVGKTLFDNGIAAANHLKAMSRDVYGIEIVPGMSREALAAAILSYHRGHLYERAGLDPQRSPYISNGLPSHENMTFPWSGEPRSTRGRTDRRPGAFALLIGLGYLSV